MRWISTLDIHGFGRDSEALRVAMDNLARFHRAGGPVHYGTDLGNGAIPSGIHVRELRLLHEAGMAIEEVLASLIRAPLEAGAPADLLVLGDSALGDLGAFDDIRLVVRGGAVVAAYRPLVCSGLLRVGGPRSSAIASMSPTGSSTVTVRPGCFTSPSVSRPGTGSWNSRHTPPRVVEPNDNPWSAIEMCGPIARSA